MSRAHLPARHGAKLAPPRCPPSLGVRTRLVAGAPGSRTRGPAVLPSEVDTGTARCVRVRGAGRCPVTSLAQGLGLKVSTAQGTGRGGTRWEDDTGPLAWLVGQVGWDLPGAASLPGLLPWAAVGSSTGQARGRCSGERRRPALDRGGLLLPRVPGCWCSGWWDSARGDVLSHSTQRAPGLPGGAPGRPRVKAPCSEPRHSQAAEAPPAELWPQRQGPAGQKGSDPPCRVSQGSTRVWWPEAIPAGDM